ncbi:MAG TPA: sulfite exporter TauE/SafE family protein [Gemmataceae bacterium]|nr:sulfite exporter TauE/SafE family protein [Gemmataceae bacterium]
MNDSLGTLAVLSLSALLAGAINSLAGGGTLFTFSALLAVVPSSVVANATSTVALVPGSLAGAWGYRREMRTASRWTLLLIVPSILGGITGSLLVTRLDEKYFSALVPWLILGAAILFLCQPLAARLAGARKKHETPSAIALAGVILFQFIVAVYGGYFGAGIGILMLSALGIMGLDDIHQMNALKTILAGCINGVSVVVFVIDHKVEWPFALTMAVAAIVGGYLGARTARRLNRRLVRWMVIAIGFGLAGYYFYQQWTKGSLS